MPDRLYFSCRLRAASKAQILDQFGKLLGVFPFSKLAKRGPALRIYAIQLAEPPVFEREFPAETAADDMVEAMRDFLQPDCACEIDTFWDLWQYDGDWKLRPAPLTPDLPSQTIPALRSMTPLAIKGWMARLAAVG